jgi:molybdopterin/thiamine biosynthesis adenylyltransferase
VRVVFCGVGALGSNAAVLCRNLDAELRFVDFDRVESKNLLAQAFVKQSIGKNKAEAMKLQLANFWGKKCDARGVRLAAENADVLLADADLVVACFDNAASRRLVADWARVHGKPLLHAAIAADGSFGLVRWDERFTADAEDAPGQATCEGGEHLPLIGLLAAAVARAVQDFVTRGERHDAMVSLTGVARTS